MPIRVLVVDDSGFFRKVVSDILNSDSNIEVVGTATNGQEAIEQVKALKPDAITMDIEMPVMDGITAVGKIMQSMPTPVLMFSTLTTDGAQATLDALDAGAMDFLPKRFEDISHNRDEARKLLCERVVTLGKQNARPISKKVTAPASTPVAETAQKAPTQKEPEKITRVVPAASKGVHKLVAIGTSTGGPVALQDVLSKLPANFPLPILLIQHMPASFTPAFAKRLNDLCEINVKEAENGDKLHPGTAYLAPGGKQMAIKKNGSDDTIVISDGDAGQTYKPCIDITFKSVASIYPRKTLAIILTGMGADGCEGAKSLKQGGSTIWSQDEASCVVYGMPAAIAKEGIADRVLNLSEIGSALVGEG